MEYRKLGRTDLDISVIGLGAMTWGVQNSQAEGFEQMDYALERGINFFDTAELYAIPPSSSTFGTTETVIGNWLASRSNREKVIIASKITGPGLPWIRNGNPIDKKIFCLRLKTASKDCRPIISISISYTGQIEVRITLGNRGTTHQSLMCKHRKIIFLKFYKQCRH